MIYLIGKSIIREFSLRTAAFYIRQAKLRRHQLPRYLNDSYMYKEDIKLLLYTAKS